MRRETWEAARRAAKQAVARAWHSTGWSRHPRRGVDYRPLRAALHRYVELTYGTEPAVTTEIVDATLRAYLAPMHARRIHIGELSGEALLGEADDQALDRTLMPNAVNELNGEYAHGVTRSSIADDARLTRALFNVHPEAVRKAMAQLSAEGLVLDFVIITEYLDANAVTASDRVRVVTQSLRRQELLIHQHVTNDVVRNAVSRFGRRVQGAG